MQHPEADITIREQGLRRALDLMRACEAEAGFLATPTDTDNYRRVWGRDSSIISIAAAASGDRELLAAAARTFETLLHHQGPHGEVPSNVDPESGRISYGGTTGRVDAGLWLVIGVGEYWRRSRDDEFLERPSASRPESSMMIDTRMTFGEIADTARGSGFAVYDARRLPLDPELNPALEDENLLAETVQLSFRSAPEGRGPGIVADLRVRDQLFHLWGGWSRVKELQQIIGGAAARPRSSPLGSEPGGP